MIFLSEGLQCNKYDMLNINKKIVRVIEESSDFFETLFGLIG